MNDQDMHLTTKDLFVAAIPTVSSAALGTINQLVGIIGGLIGIAYLAWKWNKESKE